MTVSSHIWLCVPCRYVAKRAVPPPSCPAGHPLLHMGYRWRAPRRRNERAWARVAAGEYLWDRAAVRPRPGTWFRTGKRRQRGRIMSRRLP